MSELHEVDFSTVERNGVQGVRATCSCGWWDFWAGADGSAQQSAYAHRVKVGAR